MKNRVRYLTQGAVLSALYAALCYLQNILLPGSASWLIQFRAAEALCVLALFTPAAIGGLSVGCLLFNLSFAGALPLDFLVGSAATFLATGAMYLSRRWRLFGFPFFSFLMPAVVNGLFIGWELSFYMGGAFWLNCLYVALGEGAVLFTLGALLYYGIKSRKLQRFFPG